ncbi:hypothetical protein O1611_g3973 [Lasiodiplodia mahajangana]|uniref:Uncharacterized protein n=1 Tax=Lasiodiplodia mahajangana TaxID=1108764 RepID=A0ACC2JQU0_9PEZI|nr:hypothetical protein O1611_g3973 [Lasiodiplodia mahajangana]
MDHYVEELLHTLVRVTDIPFTNVSAFAAVREALGLDSNDYRNDVTQGLYGELDPSHSTTTARYKTLVIAYAVSQTANKGYDYGSECIKLGTSPSLDDKLSIEARKIAVPLYRNYLEQGVEKQGFAKGPDFLTLFSNTDFCLAFARKVLQQDFINDQLIAVYAGGNKSYPQGIAYLYDRMRATLARMPADQVDIHGDSPEHISQSPAGEHWKPIAEKHRHFIENPQQLAQFLDMSLPLKWANEDVLQEPSFPSIGDSFNTEFTKSKDIMDLAQSATSKTDSKEEVSNFFPTGVPPPIITHTYYGRELINWMNKQASGDYGDVFKHGALYSTSQYSSPSTIGSCFVSGTRVHTRQGTIPIEKLVHGDEVLTRLPGSYGIVSTEKVEVPTRGKVWLYGFNDEAPFFTGGHIFVTKAGPKAMVPESARMENPDIQVHQITTGDVFYGVSDTDPTTYKEVEITKITTKQCSVDNVYGLHFRKGAKGTCSYHANGYLVVANYPEITLKRLKDNFSTLSRKEQRTFPQMFASIPSSLKATFGPMLTGSFESAFVKKAPISLAHHLTAEQARYKRKTDNYHMGSHHLIRHFPLMHWDNFRAQKVPLHCDKPDYIRKVQDINGVTGRVLPQISVIQGSLLIENELIKHARVDGKEIHWSRPLADGDSGDWEHGMLKTSADGFCVHGAIGTGPSPSATPAVHSLATLNNTVSVFAASTANDYSLLYTAPGAHNDGTFENTNAADSTAYPGSYNWCAFQKVEIGLSLTVNGAVQVKVTLPEVDTNWADDDPLDALYTSTSAVDQTNWVLIVTITVVGGFEEDLVASCKPNATPFFTINLKVNLATNVAWGNFTELIHGDDKWHGGAIRAIHCSYSPSVSALKNTALKAVRKSDLRAPDGMPQALTTNLHAIYSNIHHVPSPLTAHLSTFAATSNEDLPISFLQTMKTPSDSDLHAHSQNYMMSAAGYWRSSVETAVFGDERAALEKTLPDALKGNLPMECRAFLGNGFSKTLLNYSMSRNKSYEGKYSDVQKEKLQFWWTGKMQNCLARKKEYNDITAITARLAFNDLADDDFKLYRDSPIDYAGQLFKAVTDNSILNNLAFSVILGNQNLVNRYCAILNALDRQNRKFDQTLWTQVQQKQILILASGSPTFDDDFSDFMKSYMEDLAKKIASGDPSISDSMRIQMQTDLDELYATVEATDAKDLAFKLFDAQTDLMENILVVIDYYKRRPMSGVQANAPGFFQKLEEGLAKYPKLAAALPYMKGIIMVGMQAFALYKAISFLMDWKHLSDAQRVAAILTCVEAVLRAIYELASTWAEIRSLDPSTTAFRIRCVRWSNASKEKVTFQDADGDEKPVLDEQSIAQVEVIQEDGTIAPDAEPRSLSEQIAESGATTEATAETNIAKEFSLSSTVVEGVMVAVNIASAVILGMELASEWKKVGAGIRAIDTINLIVVCTQSLTGVVGVTAMVVGADLACLPAIGLLVCIAGIIMMFVEEFIPHPKPDPVQDYLEKYGYDYINELDSPPNPELQYTVIKTALPSNQVQLDMTVTQPATVIPEPMVKQLIIKIFVGTSQGDIFLPPTIDINNNVTANGITWSLIDDVNGGFQIAGNNNPDENDHSLLCRVYPTTAATLTDKGNNTPLPSPGSSIIGLGHSLKFRVVGTLNPNFTSMLGNITEILENPPDGVAGSDVIWRFTV